MPEQTTELGAHLARLSDRDPLVREKAARELFRLGCAAAEPVLGRWFADQDFRALARTGSSLLTVGLAVEPARFAAIRAASGSPPLAEVPPDQDAQEFALVFAHGVRLDILTTREPGGAGAIARFLERFGEGVQQVECDIRDVDRASEILRSRFALEPIYPQTRAGAGGTRVNFFLAPAGPDRKILMELVEVPEQRSGKRRER